MSEATEIARRYLDMHTLGFVLSNDERQEIARIMASFSAARTTHREIPRPTSETDRLGGDEA